jgi:hypothetical protein
MSEMADIIDVLRVYIVKARRQINQKLLEYTIFVTPLWSITIIDVAKKKYLTVKWLSFALERRHPRASILVSFRVSS